MTQVTPFTPPDALPRSYFLALAGLAAAPTREEKAQVLDEMAAAASDAAGAFTGRGEADSPTDPLAWHETASMLLQLSAALRGHRLSTDEPDDDDRRARTFWKNLSCALSAAEFALALGELEAYYGQRLGSADARRRLALRQLHEAGQAVAAGWPAPRS
jgi:hypothetical protein